jgi:hypothetical protein
MTVIELIHELNKYPSDTKVFISLGMTFREIKGVEEEEEINMVYLKASK